MMFRKRTKLGGEEGWSSAPLLVVAGIAMATLSLTELEARAPERLAQATPAPQASPSDDSAKPAAESKPGGTRPTTPAPEPARPNPEAQKEGAKPALPPAPAEKVAPPIKDK
jgi:hypothetical protein